MKKLQAEIGQLKEPETPPRINFSDLQFAARKLFMDKSPKKTMSWLQVLLGVALLAGICPQLAAAQDSG
jgi:hypothetical protein